MIKMNIWTLLVLIILVLSAKFKVIQADEEANELKVIQVDFINDLEEELKVLWLDPEREDEDEREVLKEKLKPGETFLVEAITSDTLHFISRTSGKIIHERILTADHDKKELYLSGEDQKSKASQIDSSDINIRFFNGFEEPILVRIANENGKIEGAGKSLSMGLEMTFEGPVGGKFIFEGKFTGEILKEHLINPEDKDKYIFLELPSDKDEDEDAYDDFDEFEEDHHHHDDDYHHEHEHEDEDEEDDHSSSSIDHGEL